MAVTVEAAEVDLEEETEVAVVEVSVEEVVAVTVVLALSPHAMTEVTVHHAAPTVLLKRVLSELTTFNTLKIEKGSLEKGSFL